jgi:cell division protein FtsW (lipid II flippase)
VIARLHTPRNRELVNLLVVGLLVVTGFGAVFIARENAVSTASLSYAGLFIGLYGVAHVVLRIALPRADPYLLPLVALLAAIGEVEIYRINPVLARDQGLWIIVGLVVFAIVVFTFRDIRKLESYRYTCGVAAVLLLAATVAVGTEVNGARLWIRFGGFQIQPGEFAKVLLVVFIAGYLRENREVLERPGRRVLGVGLPALRHLLPLLAMWGAALVLLVAVNDFGSSLLYYSILVAMLYLATGRWLYVGGGIVAFAAGAYAAVRATPHVQDRIDIWIDPWATPRTSGYQIVQSIYSIADGGIFGTGFGRGFVLAGDRTVIPDAQTDFIFSVIATETGLAGAAGLLLVYLAFVYRGMKIASLADDGFTKLLAAGLSFAIGFQAFVIVGGVTKLLPLTGITLPFVSYGGSSVVANFGLVALLLCVSERVNREGAGT